MILTNAIVAMLYVSQGGGNAHDRPNLSLQPFPDVEKLIDEGSSGANWETNLKIFEKARDKAIDLKDVCGEGRSLFWIARSNDKLRRFSEALPLYFQALFTLQEAKDQEFQALTLRNIAGVYSKVGQFDKSLKFHNQGLPLYRKLNDKDNEAKTLNDIGLIYRNRGLPDQAQWYFHQAQPLFHQVDDVRSEAAAYNNIGDVYSKIGQPDKARNAYEKALTLVQSLDVKEVGSEVRNDIEADVLNNIGLALSDLGQTDKAMEYLNRALPLFQGVHDSVGEAFVLHNIGGVYLDLGQPEKALPYYEMAQKIRQGRSDKGAEATTLAEMGRAYGKLDQPDKALKYFENALLLFRSIPDIRGEAVTLNNIGRVHQDLGHQDLAVSCFSRALPLDIKAQNMVSEATALNNIGSMFQKQGQPYKALQYMESALLLYGKAKNQVGSSLTINNVSRALRDSGNTSLAVTLGKRSVNLTQSLRGNTSSLDKGLQDAFTSSVRYRYQLLVDMLLDKGRVPESLSVLSMLKSDEYNQLWRSRSSEKNEQIALTLIEQNWLREYENLAEPVGRFGLRQIELEAIEEKSRTAEEVRELKDVSQKSEASLKTLEAYLEKQKNESRELDQTRNRIGTSESLKKLSNVLRSLPDACAIYTIVTDDGIRSILAQNGIQPYSPESTKVSRRELTQMVVEFRQLLENPNLDPRELGGKLYELLVRPIEKGIEAGKSTQLLWSLDSVLRYVPIWALYDSKTNQFLVEKYPSSLFTPGTLERVANPVEPAKLVSALGVSQSSVVKDLEGNPVFFSELPSVKSELACLNQVYGIGPLLDANFTEKSLRVGFGSNLLHIATHFRFQPGGAQDSFLVLGNNQKFTLRDFKDLPEKSLASVDLMVLSACETGVGTPNADGSEFEGLSLLAQEKGVGAVIASLWPVNDEATSKFMNDFYSYRKTKPKWTKIGCLQEAQLRMIRGESKPGKDWIPPRGTNSDPSVTSGKPWPKGEPIYRHPYFWAPFAITGNIK